MAAYVQSISLADLTAVTQSFNNVNDKIQLEKLFALLVAEFALVVVKQSTYSVTTGLQASLEATLFNVANCLRVEFLKKWITYIVTEFGSIETLGLSYVVTTDSTTALNELVDLLNQSISYLPSSEKKIGFHQINALLNTEFGLIEDADADT